jgi:hypothetical protein
MKPHKHIFRILISNPVGESSGSDVDGLRHLTSALDVLTIHGCGRRYRVPATVLANRSNSAPI